MTPRTKARLGDFRLSISRQIDERTAKPLVLFVLETSQSFAAFRYDLTVEVNQNARAISFRILGLKTPGLNLPSAGRARYVRSFENLKGTYDITVYGLDGRPSVFSVRITARAIEVLKPPSTGQLEVVTDPSGGMTAID